MRLNIVPYFKVDSGRCKMLHVVLLTLEPPTEKWKFSAEIFLEPLGSVKEMSHDAAAPPGQKVNDPDCVNLGLNFSHEEHGMAKVKTAHQLGKEALSDVRHADTEAERLAAKEKKEVAKDLAKEGLKETFTPSHHNK